MLSYLVAGLRRLQTYLQIWGKKSFLTVGEGLHVGKGTRLWAPSSLTIGNFVYIGKDVNIEANCHIGDFCLIANRVAIVGRHDHDFTALGYPVRFSPWVGSQTKKSRFYEDKAMIGDDCWLGYGAIVLTGVSVGKGSIIAAGSVVTKDIPEYSIAVGVPARVVGSRFADNKTIQQHESAIKNGNFVFSERGLDKCLIEPALASKEKN